MAMHIQQAAPSAACFRILRQEVYNLPEMPEINWRALRLALGLTQTAWAEILCVHARHIRDIEAGRSKAGGPLTALALSWSNDPLARTRLTAAGYPLTREELPKANTEAVVQRHQKKRRKLDQDMEFYSSDPLPNPLL